jgi:hypothetical protein
MSPGKYTTLTLAILIFICALAFRATVILYRGDFQTLADTENVRTAVALVQKGQLADAFGDGTGPTAHLSPAYPLLLSFVFRIVGTGAAGELAKRLLAALIASATYALYPFIAVEIGLPVGAVLWAGLLAAFLPLNFWPESSGDHEMVLIALMIALLFLSMARIWARRSLSPLSAVRLGGLAGIGTLVSPTITPLFLCWTVSTLVYFQERRAVFLRRLTLSCLALVACVLPWVVRNYRTFGVPIWSRSNFWMEINVSNNDLAHPTAEENLATLALMHPYNNGAERAKYTAIGEIAYQHDQEKQVKEWMWSHPWRFLELTIIRFFYFWFPRMASPWTTLGMVCLTLAAFLGLFVLFVRRSVACWLFAGIFVVFPLVYYVVQSIARYRYPIEWSFKLLAGLAVWATLRFILNTFSDSAKEVNLREAVR